MMRSSRVHCRCWPVSMPHRRTAISWLWRNIVTPTPGACTRQYEGVANTLSRLSKGATSRRKKLEAKIGRRGQLGSDGELAVELARQTETKAQGLARDSRTLTQWLSHDVLALSGPTLATRQ